MGCCAPCAGVEVLDAGALTGLRSEWDDLLLRSYDNRLFFTPLWHQIWWKNFPQERAYILTVRGVDGILQGVLPLQAGSDGGKSVLSLLGDFNVADYMDGAAERGDSSALLHRLWDAAFDLDWSCMRLRHVPASSPLIPVLAAVAAERGHRVNVENDEVSPVALLCSNWDGYLQMLSKKQRHEIRRKLRRAEEGVESIWRTVSDPGAIDAELSTFFRLHELSAREKAGFFTPRMRSFFQEVAVEYFHAGWLRLSFFRRDGSDVASTMSSLYRDRWLLYNSGYDPTQAAHSPGIAAVAYALQDAIAESAVAFDFLSGDEPYKYQFGATNTYTCKVSVDR